MRFSEGTCLLAAALVCGFGVPRAAYAVNGCTNAYLSGTYNAQVTTANLTALVSGLNTAGTGTTGTGTTGTGTTGTGTTGTGTTTSSVPDSLALGGNSSSLVGNQTALGRYYFDGSGNVIGLASGSTTSNPLLGPLGTYTVNSNCSGKITLTGGRTFDIVVGAQGQQAAFLETDANGGGAIGTLIQTTNVCVSTSPASYIYSFTGGINTTGTGTTGTGTTGTGTTGTGTTGTGTTGTGTTGTGTTGTGTTGTGTTGTGTTGTGTTGTGTTGTGTTGTGTTGTGTTGTGTTGTGTTGTGTTGTGTTTTPSLQAQSAIGILNLDGSGNFTMTQSSYANGQYSPQTAGGTYTVGNNCAATLTFNSSNATGGFTAPSKLYLLLNQSYNRTGAGASAGFITIQPTTGQTLTGQIYQQ